MDIFSIHCYDGEKFFWSTDDTHAITLTSDEDGLAESVVENVGTRFEVEVAVEVVCEDDTG